MAIKRVAKDAFKTTTGSKSTGVKKTSSAVKTSVTRKSTKK